MALIREVTTVEWNLLNCFGGDHMANGGGRPIEQRHFRANEHGLVRVANGQAKITHQGAADVHVQRFDALRPKAGRLRHDRVPSIWESR